MSQKIARYAVSRGLVGCYMPDSQDGPYYFSTRKELAATVRYELEVSDWPARLIREVQLRRLWRFIQAHGSSSAHFSIDRKGYEISFRGLTEEEATAMDKEGFV